MSTPERATAPAATGAAGDQGHTGGDPRILPAPCRTAKPHVNRTQRRAALLAAMDATAGVLLRLAELEAQENAG